jgi:endonuclease YncB( thermonuclease family)
MELYNYMAIVTKVIDGDTVKLTIDYGFRTYGEYNCRLAGINAAELGSGGEPARDYLKELLPEHSVIKIKSKKLDKYGRPIIEIPYKDTTINQILLDKGLAKPYMQ